MSNASTFFGAASSGGAATHVGAIVRGLLAGNPDYLPCDGSTYLKSAYPALDTTCLETFGENPIVRGGTVGTAEIMGLEVVGSRIFVITKTASTTFHTSDDGGNTFTARTLPVNGNIIGKVMQANGRVFIFCTTTNNGVYSTTDGITWANHSTALNVALPWSTYIYVSAVGYIGGLYVFMRATNVAGAFLIATSPDLVTFTQRDITSQLYISVESVNTVQTHYPVIYSQRFGMVFNLSSGNYNYLVATPDGLNFNSVMPYALIGATAGSFSFSQRSYELPDGTIVSSDGLSYFNGMARSLDSVVRPAVNGTVNVAPLWRALCARVSMAESTTRVVFSENLGVTRKVVLLPSGTLGQYSMQTIANNRWFLANSSGAFYYRDIDTTRFVTPVMRNADSDLCHGKLYIKVR